MRVGTLHRKIVADVEALYSACGHLWPVVIPEHYTRPFSLKVFVRRLNKLTEPLGVFNEIKLDWEMPPGEVQLAGLWLYKSNLPENGSSADLRLLWHVHPSTKKVQFSQVEWNRRRFRFWQMLMHELVHRYQGYRDTRVYSPRSQQRDIKEDQEYYGSVDEIEAHSHNAAMELFVWWGALSYKNAVTEAMSYSGRILDPTYSKYDSVFCQTGRRPLHPAMKHFERKVKAWYDVMVKYPEIYNALELPQLVS